MNDSTISKTRPPLSDAAAIVLAGGRGLRLGRIDKAMLPIEGRPLIDRTLSKLDPIFAEIVLVARHSEPLVEFGYPIVLDRRPGSGPLGGLESGLEAISASRAFLVGCDMPHLDADLVRLLAGIEPDSPAVVPGNLDRLQPLHAFYRTEVGPHARSALDEGQRSMRDLLDRIEWRRVDPAEFAHLPDATRSFFNVNTPDDLALLRSPKGGA